jgi:hypothetical protein
VERLVCFNGMLFDDLSTRLRSNYVNRSTRVFIDIKSLLLATKRIDDDTALVWYNVVSIHA